MRVELKDIFVLKRNFGNAGYDKGNVHKPRMSNRAFSLLLFFL